MRFAGVALLVALCGSSQVAVAETSTPPEGKSKGGLADLFSAFGFTEKRQISGKSCRVVADIKQEELIKSAPLLQKLEILNSEMSQTTIRTQPTKVAMAFAIQASSVEVKSLFDDEAGVDRCSFVQNLTSLDDYGNEKTINMYSYDFDRATFSKINWDKFQSTNLIKVAKGFKFNPEVMARVSGEPD